MSLNPKTVVYLLRSERDPSRLYVGLTSDLVTRLETHNSGGSRYTASSRPWQLLVAVDFSDERTAVAFERYLKSGSGRAFARRHFLPQSP